MKTGNSYFFVFNTGNEISLIKSPVVDGKTVIDNRIEVYLGYGDYFLYKKGKSLVYLVHPRVPFPMTLLHLKNEKKTILFPYLDYKLLENILKRKIVANLTGKRYVNVKLVSSILILIAFIVGMLIGLFVK